MNDVEYIYRTESHLVTKNKNYNLYKSLSILASKACLLYNYILDIYTKQYIKEKTLVSVGDLLKS